MFPKKIALAAALSVSLALPAGAARADEPVPAGVTMGAPAIPRPVVPLATPVANAPRLSPLAPTPKPVMSEGAKAGFIAGGIVVAALIIGGVIIIHH